MIQQFINRKEETGIIRKRCGSGNPELIIIYGRRRVGKTELVSHSLKGLPSIYFLAEERADAENLREMRGLMSEFLKDPDFARMEFEDWVSLFTAFSQKAKGGCAVAIDEFPYIVERDSSVPSKFQKIWDTAISRSKISLMLIGSSISMMEGLLGSHSPLYGRRTAQLEVKPLSAFEGRKFSPEMTFEESLLMHGCAGGIPLYLNAMKGGFFEAIEKNFLRRDSLLYAEAEFLLKQEFRDVSNYFSILKAIAFGNTRHGEIATKAEMEKGILSKYLQNLEKIRVIRREYPAGDAREKRKNVRFRFADNYYNFWFRFVYPNRTAIEKGDSGKVLEKIKKEYAQYFGPIFEDICIDFLWKAKPLEFSSAGRWWRKDIEIDICTDGEIPGFFECKWKDLGEKEVFAELAKLKRKCEAAGMPEKAVFGIFARSISGKSNIRDAGFLAFDLEDFENI